jgi:hypothetical protein
MRAGGLADLFEALAGSIGIELDGHIAQAEHAHQMLAVVEYRQTPDLLAGHLL